MLIHFMATFCTPLQLRKVNPPLLPWWQGADEKRLWVESALLFQGIHTDGGPSLEALVKGAGELFQSAEAHIRELFL